MLNASTLGRLIVAVALVGAAGTAVAIEPSGGLSGPSVQDRKVPGVNGTFGERGDRRPGQYEVPAQVVRQALEEALGPGAPEAVRASDAQHAKVRGLLEAFQVEQRKFMEENRAEMAKYRSLGGPRRKPGEESAKGAPKDPRPAGGTGEMSEMTDEQRSEMMERARELREKMPKFADTQTKIWAELSDAQKQAVEARLEAWRTEQQKKEAERYAERQLKQRENAAPNAKGPANPGGPAREITPEQRERFMRALERMSPEQREQLLQRIEEMMRQRGGEGAGAAPANPPAPGTRPNPRRPGAARPGAPAQPPAPAQPTKNPD